MKPATPVDRGSLRHRTTLPRFMDAFSGVYQAYREEPNLRFHIFAGSCVALAGYAVGFAPWEVAYLAATIVGVLLAEMVNTAVERTVDLAAAGRRHRLAAQAKEVAAGVVLLAALHAAFAAVLLFVVQRGFVATVSAVVAMSLRSPLLLVIPVVTGVMGLIAGGKRQ